MAKRTPKKPTPPRTLTEIKRLEEEADGARAALEAARKEIADLKKRHQAEQVRALAERTEIEKKLAASEKARRAAAKGEREAEDERERKAVAALKDEVARLEGELERHREEDEAFAAGVERAARSVEALRGVEATPTSVLASLVALAGDLERRLGEAAEVARELEEERQRSADAERLEGKVSDLVALNRDLQERLDASRGDVEAMSRAATESKEALRDAVKEEAEKGEGRVAELKRQLAEREAEKASLLDQLKEEGRTPFLSPAHVSRLIDGFYSEMASQLKGLDVQDSELRLKVGFGGISGEKSGIVVPTADNIADIREGLSEVVVRLGRRTP